MPSATPVSLLSVCAGVHVSWTLADALNEERIRREFD